MSKYFVAGAGSTDYNTTPTTPYAEAGVYNTAPYFQMDAGHFLWYGLGFWNFSSALSGAGVYSVAGSISAPPLTGWGVNGGSGTAPAPTLTLAPFRAYASDRYVGSSLHAKPSDAADGATFLEEDTKDEYVMKGRAWVLQSRLSSGGDLLSTLMNSEIAVTAATTLTSTAFGKMHVCSGTTADYAIGLPAASGNAGKIIGFRMASGLTRLVTLDANVSELIDGTLTRIMWAQEAAILLCDGTGWIKIGGKSRPMLARIKANATQTIAVTTSTKVLLPTLDYQVGYLSDAANSRIKAVRPCKMRLNGMISYSASTASWPRVLGDLQKNGTTFARNDLTFNALNFPTLSPHDAVDMAVNDYIELSTYHQGTSGAISTTNNPPSFITAEEISGW